MLNGKSLQQLQDEVVMGNTFLFKPKKVSTVNMLFSAKYSCIITLIGWTMWKVQKGRKTVGEEVEATAEVGELRKRTMMPHFHGEGWG